MKDGQNHNVTCKEMLFLSTLSLTQRISRWFLMAELLIHLQGHVAQTYTHTHSPLFITGDMPISSLSKQPTFGNATTGFPTKWRLRNEHRNSILMTHHYSDLGGASDWLNQISHAAQLIRSTTQIWVVTRHQYGTSVPVSRRHFTGKPVMGSQNVRCFLRLDNQPWANFFLCPYSNSPGSLRES